MTTPFKGTLVGVSGRKRHGKDIISDHLCAKYGFVKISIADPIRQIIGKQLLYLTDEQLEDGEKKEEVDVRWGKSPRELLQTTGSIFRDEIDVEFWAKRCMYRVAEIWSRLPESRVVVNDIRYPNELEAVSKVGKVIKVIRLNYENSDPHESENALDGTPNEMYDKVISAMSGEIQYIQFEVDKFMEAELNASV